MSIERITNLVFLFIISLVIVSLLYSILSENFKPYPSKQILDNNEKIRSAIMTRYLNDPKHTDNSFILN